MDRTLILNGILRGGLHPKAPSDCEHNNRRSCRHTARTVAHLEKDGISTESPSKKARAASRCLNCQ
jgi:hypothetical protein